MYDKIKNVLIQTIRRVINFKNGIYYNSDMPNGILKKLLNKIQSLTVWGGMPPLILKRACGIDAAAIYEMNPAQKGFIGDGDNIDNCPAIHLDHR